MFDQTTRNRLQKFVGDTRALLADEFTRQLQQDYGLDPASGEVSPLESLRHLDAARLETARLLRDTLEHYRAGSPGGSPRDLLQRIVREQAFTVLNRLCALRLAEARGILLESVGNGYQSRGFQLYARLAGTALGDTGGAYRSYLFSLFDEFAVDLAVLFDRYAITGRLFPRESALLELLDKLNHPDLETLWAQDETIGWIYQYFNSQEERRQMRAESQAPRNSRELAVRNQFFTPRYVVEFLTDNTLGRIWYEMTKGETGLVGSCRYLVRRPNEIFLAPDVNPTPDPSPTGRGDVEYTVGHTVEHIKRHSTEVVAAPSTSPLPVGEGLGVGLTPGEGLTQKDILHQPVQIPHRPLKDPRTIRMLDPACGSMHFGLYAFDLYERIYEEAWALEETHTLERPDDLQALRATYAGDYEAFRRDVPRLILEYNIHGVDIDPRAAQIAGLSLWLRAQRSWQEQGVKAAERPRIERSNIVCAEPMPGEKDLLREFTAGLHPPVLGQLVEHIFEKMELAGEAGSLLKIEEEIAGAVDKARQAFEKELKVGRQSALFAEDEKAPFDFSGLGRRTNFWSQAEQRILDALQAYAEQAEGNTRRRLFARDAARGFAFIDLCRKRYDVVLMNPPFGEPLKKTREMLGLNYPSTKHDLFATFTERTIAMLTNGGLLGELSSRVGFFLKSFQDWRVKIIGAQSLLTLADLGFGVLDDATVEATCYVVEKRPPVDRNLTIVFRLLTEDDKEKTLLEAMSGRYKSLKFIFDVNSCGSLPLAPWIYWVSQSTREKLALHNQLEPSGALIRQGLGTGDNNRFLRALWEVPPQLIASTQISGNSFGEQFSIDKRWAVHVRSGSSQPWYSPLTVLIDWENQGYRLKEHWRSRGESPSRYIPSEELYFRPGFSWTLRAFRLIPYLIPSGCIPSASRYMGFPHSGHEFTALGIVASNFASCVARFYGEMFERPKHLVDTVKRLPYVGLSEHLCKSLQIKITKEVESRQRFFRNYEPFFDFILPADIKQWANNDSSNWNPASFLGETLELDVAESFDLSKDEFEELEFDLKEAIQVRRKSNRIAEDNENESDDESSCDTSNEGRKFDALSYLLGTTFARWDIRYATGAKPIPDLPDPFAPLPVCPPGMLQNAQGLPAAPEDVPADYPLRLTWGGILVDDEGHPEDVAGRVREALAVIWGARAGDIEQEACDILGVKSLRDYFRAPAKFFAEHLKRYSKSRRQAPIYWPLGTPSGSYTLWLYYHRLSDQTLYTAVNDFVEPKLRQVEQQTAALRAHGGRDKTEEKALETLLHLEQELRDLRDELLRVAAFWKPNLNDGVVITAAPLWRLFQHKPWQKNLKATWEALEKGDYDWAHLAYSIWPERVVQAARKDRSIAIAHDLKSALWLKAVDGKGKETWVGKELNENDLQQLAKKP